MAEGTWGSAAHHDLYIEPITGDKRHRRKCRCGCGRKATHRVMANGVCLSSGCELEAYRSRKKLIKARRMIALSGYRPRW